MEAPDGVLHVFAVNADGGDPRILATDAQGPQISWPWVVYDEKPATAGAAATLARQNIETGEVTPIEGPADVSYFAYDGEALAWISADSRSLFVQSPLESSPSLITFGRHLQFVSVNQRLVGWGQEMGARAYDRKLKVIVELSNLHGFYPVMSARALDWLYQPDPNAPNPYDGTVWRESQRRRPALRPGVAGWLRVSAFLMAAISVATFVAFMSISGPIPKAIAYGSNPLFAAYSFAPLISGLAGLLAVIVGLIALRGSPRSLAVALVGVAVGFLLFFFITGLVANAMSPVMQPPIEGKGVASPSFPLIVLSPPVVGISGVAIATAVALSRLRDISGRRLAIAALVMGGVVAAYWLFSLLVLNFGGE